MKFKTWVEINKSALEHNIQTFRHLIGPRTKLMAVVKSNAYGHGLHQVAKIAESHADFLGVDSIDEALETRRLNIKTPILILGYTLLSRLKEAVDNDISLVIYNKKTIEKLGRASVPPAKSQGETPWATSIKVHIKVETGTGRQGVLEKDIADFVKLIKKYPSIQIEGIYTHFANIEDTTDHSYAQKQLDAFKRIVKTAEETLGGKILLKHTACSAATILFPETRFDMVRLGISMYGLWPSKETLVSARETGRNQIDLKPVLTWKTRVAQIKEMPAGSTVSYGLTEKLSRDTKIAVLPIGYADGYDRKLSSIGNVLINGTRSKVIGRICMNMTMVDVSHLPDVNPAPFRHGPKRCGIKIEDEVVLLGEQGSERITVEELAQKIGTINYEVVTRINPLLPRVVV